MTEQNISQNVSGELSLGNNASSQPNSSAPIETISKSDATNLAHSRYNAGRDKGKEEGFREGYEKALQENSAKADAAHFKPPSNPADLTEIQKELFALKEKIKKGEEEGIRAHEAAQIREIGSQLAPKIESARAKYEDFDKVVNQEILQSVPHLIPLANEVDNAGDVMYELLNNPEKLGQIYGLPLDLSRRAIQKLSTRLKNNEASANLKVPKSPISQPQASHVKNVNKKADISSWKNHRW